MWRRLSELKKGVTFKKKGFLIVSIFFLSLFTVLPIMPMAQASPAPTEVVTTMAYYVEYEPHLRTMFFASGLHWVSYYQGTSGLNGTISYKTTDDGGATWSSEIDIREWEDDYDSYSVWYDNTYCYYVYENYSQLYFRRGLPEENGTITWSAAEQTIPTVFEEVEGNPAICSDSEGYVWVAYQDYNESASGYNKYPCYVTRSGNTDGTWGATPAGFPYRIANHDTFADTSWEFSLIPLTGGKVYVLYRAYQDYLYGMRWDGVGWGAENMVDYSGVYASTFSAVADGDDVDIVYHRLQDLIYKVMYVKYLYESDTFSSEEEIVTPDTPYTFPVLSKDFHSGDLYCFGYGFGVNTSIYYIRRIDGTWDDTPTEWISCPNILDVGMISVEYNVTALEMGFSYWDHYTGPPYDIMFEGLTLPGLVLGLPFDDESGNVARDWTTYENNGTIVGASRVYNGYFGKALDFNGVNSGVDCGDDSSLDLTDAFAIQAWVNLTVSAANYNASIVSKGQQYDLAIDTSSTKVSFKWYNGGWQSISSSSLLVVGSWYNVAGVWDGNYAYIYVNGVLEGTSVDFSATPPLSSVDNVTIGMVFGGTNYFSGLIDEVKIYNSAIGVSDVLSGVGSPIADYPYNEEITISNMEGCDNWLFARQRDYLFVGKYVNSNSSRTFANCSMAFSDGYNLIVASFNESTSLWGFRVTDAASLGVSTYSRNGNLLTVTFGIFLTDNIYDCKNVDISMYCRDTSGSYDGWEVKAIDYFHIYNLGGLPSYEYAGDGSSIVGEDAFGLYAKTAGSWARANVTWQKFQHFHALFHWFLNTTWDSGGEYWCCPEDHANTGYVEFGVDYCYNDTWLEGWKVHLTIIDGSAGTYGVGTNHAWVRINATWYNRGMYVRSDQFYAFFESYQATDDSTYFSLVIDLWIDSANISSVGAGRIAPEYYGMDEGGWGPWATWGPRSSTSESSVFKDNIYGMTNATVISARGVSFFTVWATVNKTSADAGTPDCDSHAWYMRDFQTAWQYLGSGEIMRGLDAVLFVPTLVVGMPQAGFLSSLLAGMVDGVTKPIVNAILSTAGALGYAVASVINMAFGYFGLPNFVGMMTTMITAFVAFMSFSAINVTTLIVQILTLLLSITGFIVDWVTRMVSFFVLLMAYVSGIFSGGYGAIGGLTNIWTLINLSGWIDAVPIFATIAWFAAIDDRARKGQGWFATFWGDLSIMIGVLSFMIDMFFRIINFVTDMVFRLMGVFTRR
jgi:hypothetical protein